MIGMDAATGRRIEGDAHLRQSIRDILTTPLGSRIGRRDYGSQLPALIDAAWTATTRMRLFAAVATALLRWEPRIRLTNVAIAPADRAGAFVLTLDGERTDRGEPTRLIIPLGTPAA